LSTDTLASIAAVYHEMNMRGVGKAHQSDDFTGLNNLPHAHTRVNTMPIAQMHALLKRTDILQNLELDDTRTTLE
jgi:hypothetical protein